MKTSIKLIIVAFMALGIGLAYASPMFMIPINVQPFPQVPEGPKADFTVNVVYANFNTVNFQNTEAFNNQDGSINHTETYPATNVSYDVVLNVTNPSNHPATLYQISFRDCNSACYVNPSSVDVHFCYQWCYLFGCSIQ